MYEVSIMCIIGLGSEITTVMRASPCPPTSHREAGINMWWDNDLQAYLGWAC